MLLRYGLNNSDWKYKKRIDSLKRIGVLYKRLGSIKYKDKQISKDEYIILLKIKKLLEKHNSRYYVVITPLYDQLKFESGDLKIIKNIFGSNCVYDFSGINLFTNNEYNYPDGLHFLPYISKIMADSIITSQKNNNLIHLKPR
jgi:hypothetical protein